MVKVKLCLETSSILRDSKTLSVSLKEVGKIRAVVPVSVIARISAANSLPSSLMLSI